MTREIMMPQLGFTMVDGTIAAWLKREGEPLAKGEPLMEVTSEKASVEVESPLSGVLRRLLVAEGQTVKVGTPVCLVAEEGEVPSEMATAFPTSGREAGTPALAASTPNIERGAAPLIEGLGRPDAPPLRASGLAKRLARERGIALAMVQGSGPGGRVLEADVLRATGSPHPDPLPEGEGNPPLPLGEAGRRPGEGKGTLHPSPSTPYPSPAAGWRVPFAGIRRLTAERMFQSVHSSAQVTLVAEVDATEAVRMRTQLLPEWEKEDGVRLTFTDMIVRACGKALREHPALNATLAGEEILLREEVNVGIAVDADGALVVPVLRSVDVKPLRVIASESRDLVARARRKAMSVDDASGGTFTVTNLGTYGIEFFTPIINPPESAILGVGRIAERPAVYKGEICKRSLMYLSLTFDHRLVDGRPAAEFLQRLRELLQKPYLLLA
jgi:pyruvate dehydrogenase E2 component (dihydrolipoamide acetyltransferase)